MADLEGVVAATLTPLDSDGTIAPARLAGHCLALLGAGCAAVALFGTTGEGPSFSLAERRRALEAVVARGVPPDRLLVGLQCTARDDAVNLARDAAAAQCASVFMMPPFFFKEPGDEALFAAYASVLDGLGAAARRFFLYNFPALADATISPDLLARLATAFPEAIAGIKDSGGDLAATRAFIARCPHLAVYAGWEPHAAALYAEGCRGTVSGMANVVPAALVAAFDDTRALAPVEPLIEAVAALPAIPAIRALTAIATADDGWRRPRPPLLPLDAAAERRLVELLP